MFGVVCLLTLLTSNLATTSFYDLSATDISGNLVTFDEFRGSVVLIVNVASQCGYTESNYLNLQRLYRSYSSSDFEILGFPCNDFGKQEPWDENEIDIWTKKQYNIEFKLFKKIHVNGNNISPVYKYLKSKFPGDINWNFDGKFLISRSGEVVKRFDVRTDFNDIEKSIRVELAKPVKLKRDSQEKKDL